MSAIKADRYAAYKDSGAAWMGEIPEHWKFVRVKDLISKITSGVTPRGGAESYVDVGIPFLRSQNVHNDGLHLDDVSFISEATHQEMSNSQVKPGDIVFNITGASIARTCIVPEAVKTANISQHIALLRPRKFNEIKFISYYLQSQLVKDYVYLTQSGASKEAFNHGQMKCIPMSLPSRPEQAVIAAYLDVKTSQIDRQIELLGQKAAQYGKLKQSLINETVTRGLNKSVGMKDSGVEWIGKTPTHWNVRRLKEVVDVHMGQSPSSSDYTEEGLGFPFLQGNADFGNYSPTPRVWCSEVKKVCLKNDVLLSVRAPVGAVNVASASYGIGRGLCAIRSKSNYQYWYYFLSSMSSYLNSIATGSTYVAVSIEDVRNSMACVPPAHEQAKITSYLNDRTERIDQIVTAINYQLEKLKDLRKALINDVVTGKIKVVGIGNDE